MADSATAENAVTIAGDPSKAARAVVSVDFDCRCELWRDMLADWSLAERAIRAAIDAAAPRGGSGFQVSVLLTSDREIRDLNRAWRGKDAATNVLSFPLGATAGACEHGHPLGDIVLAAETVCREAAEAGRTIGQHTAHLVVHGALHLLGLDHGSAADAHHMEALEIQILARLGVPDPYGAAADSPRAQ